MRQALLNCQTSAPIGGLLRLLGHLPPLGIKGQYGETILAMTEATPAHLKPPAPNLGRRAAIASFYTVAARIILRCIGLVSTLILVRLLSPADFGLIGLASVVYGILNSLTATGFGMAIIRMEAPRKIHYDTAWTLTMMRGALISAALVLSSHLQARLMGDPRIAGLMHVLAITAMLQSLENIRLVELQRNLQFDKIMIYTVLTKIVGFVIVVPLAFYMRNYWPLLLSPMLMRFITIPYSYWLAPCTGRASRSPPGANFFIFRNGCRSATSAPSWI